MSTTCPTPLASKATASSQAMKPHPLNSRTPLLFLPVYIETRFVDRPTGPELWVRIFPDQISINSHEQELTSQEIADGQIYWNAVWLAGTVPPATPKPGCVSVVPGKSPKTSPNALQAAWQQLATKYGAQRAAWIALQMTPTNVTQQPTAAAPAASLVLNIGSGTMKFTCSRPGAAGNRVQVAIDVTSRWRGPVAVSGDLVSIYAKWDGTLHTADEIARSFPSASTSDGGPILLDVSGVTQPLTAKPATNLSGGQDPAPTPIFPCPPIRPSSWEKAAFVDALPDAWTLVLVSGTEQTSYTSPNPITPGLPISLDPHSGTIPPGSPVDSGLRWLVEFQAAVDAGMGLQIKLRADQRQNGFDRIFVYGLRTGEENGSGTLANLLDAHHYADGLALVPQGSSTTSTKDAVSAYSRKDPQYAVSFAVERSGPLIQSPQYEPDLDGNRFATLLGFDPERMTNVQYSQCTASQNGSDMLAALWPSTVGYFLKQVMWPVFSAEQIAAARQYAVSYAIPRGPISAFRVGTTPYGVLPITALSKYQLNFDNGGTRNEQLLVQLLRQLWPTWLQSASNAPHLQRTGDPDTHLALVLGMDASSTSFRGRQVFGADFLWNYMGFIGTSPQEKANWWAEQLQPGRTLLDSYGLNDWDPRLVHLSAAQSSFPVTFPTVVAGQLSETDPLPSDAVIGTDSKGNPIAINYIQWLQQASVGDIRADNYPGPRPTALLYKILRQSLILEYAGIAYTGEIVANRLDPSQTREPELIGMGKFQTQAAAKQSSLDLVGVWDVLDRYVDPNAIKKQKWSDYLVSIASQTTSPYPDLNDLYARMGRLALLPTAELDRLFTETLDACSHRLDVWVTSVATAILTRTRRESSGVFLAAYGWLEDVRPESNRAPVRGAELQASDALDAARAKLIGPGYTAPPTPLQPQTDNGGFIYAPSQDQAAVAAILRSGYRSHIGTSDQDSLSIDLSSERVQGALMLLDGVRQGQSMNALLGYLFESGLHQLSLDKYIQPFRNCFPMAANQLTASDPSAESVAASNVVDGLALKSAFDNGQLEVGTLWPAGATPCKNLPDPGQSSDQKAIVNLLQKVNAYADALGDLSIAETIFQTVRGNFERGGGLLAAVAKGQQPPEPEVLNTQRGGLDITQRAALLFVGPPPANAWSNVTPRARAMAEPLLDSWLSQVLPQPSASVTCKVSYHDQTSGDQTVSVDLTKLGLAPLDCIAMAEGSTSAAQRSELEYRILYAAGVSPTADLNSITITYPPSSNSSLSFPDMLYLWKTFRLLINGARPLAPQDFSLPSQKVADNNASANFQALLARAKAALSALQNDLAFLSACMPGKSQSAQLPTALLNCSFYGLAGSVPLSNVATDVRLGDQATYVSNALGDRSGKAATLINNPAATSSDLLSAFALIFGNDFVVLPSFAPPDPASLGGAFAQSTSLVANDPSAPTRWLSQLTYVRPAIARLDAALSLADMVGQGTTQLPKLWLGQLPLLQNDQWLALPWDPANPPGKGRVAFACFALGDPSSTTASTYSGLMIDQWIDRVPSPEEKAAVTFHYEEPKARPPQCLLLAVCPDRREFWDGDLVTAILQEALELTKIRSVDLASIQQVGQVLPALYFPFNLQGATISTAFFSMKESINASPGADG